ncbi:MAG: hypothetical protein GKR95_05205 [Gammaproteobacteria bacterium]|nr:hypothetical protein [Gammaproteobacteria bacterium]
MIVNSSSDSWGKPTLNPPSAPYSQNDETVAKTLDVKTTAEMCHKILWRSTRVWSTWKNSHYSEPPFGPAYIACLYCLSCQVFVH